MAEENYNLDELVPPSFLNETYIVDVIRQVEDDPELHVINFDIKPGSKAGDHYASVMFKIIATYGTKGRIVNERRFILKTIPEAEGPKKDLLENHPAFKNEILMYTKTLPGMEKILKEHGENGWWPKLVYSQPKPFVLMFDDLTVNNYEVVYDPLDFDHIELIVDKIAKYHALSLVLIDRGHEEIKDYKMVMNEEMSQLFKPMGRVISQVAQHVSTWPGYKQFAPKMDKYVEGLPNMMLRLLNQAVSGDFHVLNHGDFHIRNLMFKKSTTGQLNEVLFLDFQMPHYNIPCFDLFGLLTSMGTEEVRRRENDVIKMYQRLMVASLKKFGYNGKLPSVIDIQVTLMRLAEYRVFYVFVLLPLFRLRNVEFGALLGPEPIPEIVSAIDATCRDPLFIDDIKLSLDKFDALGIFDDE